MRRPPHGATTRPGPRAPGNGYGRLVGRPGPRVPIVAAAPVEPAGFGAADADDADVAEVAFPAPFPLDPAPTP